MGQSKGLDGSSRAGCHPAGINSWVARGIRAGGPSHVFRCFYQNETQTYIWVRPNPVVHSAAQSGNLRPARVGVAGPNKKIKNTAGGSVGVRVGPFYAPELCFATLASKYVSVS